MNASENSAFDRALAFTLRWEGGYVNDPRDPGGETKYGISKRAYPHIDIKNLTKEQAAAIYRRDYWDAARCGKLPERVAVAHFDCAVNCGVTAANRVLQRAASAKDDGIIGPATLQAVWDTPTTVILCRMLTERLGHYLTIIGNNSTLAVFARGWWNRVAALANEVGA